MNVLSLNSGSSSIKFKVFNSSNLKEISSGEIKIFSESSLSIKINGNEKILDTSNWSKRFELIAKSISHLKIDYVLHRIVHGGELYVFPILLTESIIKKMQEDLFDLAPLHNPYAFEVIEKSMNIYGNAKHIAVFDSAFGMTMPEINYLYGLPLEYYKKYKVRRYAFHGLSHKFVSQLYLNHISDDEEIYSNSNSQEETLNNIRIVSMHLGSGCSTCAIKGTQCVDTSFGFTPEENLIMSTRVGEIDYTAVEFIKKKESLSDKAISDMLNKKSGLLGLSGYTKDMKKIVGDYKTNPRAKLTLDLFVNSVVKQVYNMIASLNGVDVLIFTGGIGQASPVVREMICERLSIFRIYIDVDKNVNSDGSKDIFNVTRKDSLAQIYIVATNEELEMIEECKHLIT